MRFVTQAAFKDVSLSEYLGGFGATLQAEVFCSPYWQDTCCREVSTPQGRKVRVNFEVYPPGGKGRTTMCRCGICGKWAPRSNGGSACIDCQIEAEEESFERRLECLRRDGECGFVELLQRLRWRRPFSPQRREVDAESPTQEEAEQNIEEKFDENEDDLPPVMEVTTFHQQEFAEERYWLANVLDIPEQPTPARNDDVIVRLVRRHLAWVGRDTPRRAIGCSVILLPESEEKLREEIADYETTGSLKPRAKRQDTVNPRVRYRGEAHDDAACPGQ